MKRDIIKIWFFEHPPETVWEFLTEPELIAQWLMKNNFKPIVGYKFNFYAKPKVKFGFDGTVHCEVLEVKPFSRLSYSWKGGPGNGKITLDSVVTWSLTPKDSGTELQLEHTGFKGLKNYFAYLAMNTGWGSTIRMRLEALLNERKEGLKNV